ncbi:MAG: DUF4129 domain-containing protein, partial [Desulforhopalus sp.]
GSTTAGGFAGMTEKRQWFILVAILGMDFSWLYGWASLTMLSSFNQPLPQMTILSVACLATLLTLTHHHRGWRYYQIGGAHLVCLILACAVLTYEMGNSDYSFFDAAWIKEFFTTPRAPVGWLMQAVALFWCIAFWIAATRLAVLPRNYLTVSNHFDFGVIALLLLHLIEVLILVEGDIILTELSLPRILFSFFAFSVPAFCLTRCAVQGKSDFITGFRGIGVILSFLTLFLLLGSGVAALFLPYLTVAAETGVAVLKTVTTPIGEFLLRILMFLFGHRQQISDPAVSSSSQQLQLQDIANQPMEGWVVLLQNILFFLAAGLGILLVFALCALVILQLGWWLSRRGDAVESSSSPWQQFRKLMHKLIVIIMMCWNKIRNSGKRNRDPVQLYLSLMAWGAMSGLALVPSETPKEYGSRLIGKLPAAEEEIHIIIAVHNVSIYGGLQDTQVQRGWSAYTRLLSPRLWPARMKSLLFR